jgi:plasmid segregation protein ParM
MLDHLNSQGNVTMQPIQAVQSNAIIRAIDLGFGYTKYTARNPHPGSTGVVTRQFPSVCVPVTSDNAFVDLDPHSNMKSIETVRVVLEDRAFDVGPEAAQLLAGGTGRTHDQDYSRTPNYEALMLGALFYMSEPVIDRLVLGLPVSRFRFSKARLVERFAKDLYVPVRGRAPDEKRKVTVNEVTVLPQPLGGFMLARANSRDFNPSLRGSTLVVDPGYVTFDWIVVSDSGAYLNTRSDALDGCMSRIHNEIARFIARDTQRNVDGTHELDNALRHGQPFMHYGKAIDLSKYAAVARSTVDLRINEMMVRMGKDSDIVRVIVCGGGASLFTPVLKERFPDCHFMVLNDPMTANVRGFQLFGDTAPAPQRKPTAITAKAAPVAVS